MDKGAFCSVAEVTDKIEQAHEVDVDAYLLSSAMERALEVAAARGADVHVRLNAIAFGPGERGIEERNAAAIGRLTADGVDAQLCTQPTLHLKAALVDGTSYFDDCNWTSGDDLIYRDTHATTAQAIVAIRHGEAPANARVEFYKADALAAEEHVLAAHPRALLEVATETLNRCAVTNLLAARAKRQNVRVVVDARTFAVDATMRKTVGFLTAAGVAVRTAHTTEKLAVAGSSGWIGSANATWGDTMLDWGAQLQGATMVGQLRAHFRRLWQSAHAVTAADCAAPSDAR